VSRKRRRVPRPIRRGLLLAAWVAASTLLVAEIALSIRLLLD
jgi:hypothetical protein